MMAETNEVDRLSSLPDEVLAHILSFMQRKDAVATSVLSKRWEYIWTNVPVLDFCIINSSSNLRPFMDRVLIFNDAPFLRVFRFHLITTAINCKHLCSWIMNIMRRNVFEVDIKFFPSMPFEVESKGPSAVTIVNDKIKVLKVTSTKGSCLWFPFPRLSLPKLLILKLSNLRLEDEAYVNHILSALPCLNEFRLYDCSVLQTLHICSSSLKRLAVDDITFHMKRQMQIIIDIPSLEYLSIVISNRDCKFNINAPSLIKAHFEICGTLLIEVLKQVPSLKTLEIVLFSACVALNQLPLLPKLTCLSIECYCLSETFSHRLKFLLCERAPNLVSLKYRLPWSDTNESPPLPNVVPKCVSSTLKVIDFYNFHDTPTDYAMAEYFLRHAKVLGVIKIHFTKNSTKEVDAISRLLRIPMASSACEFVICRSSLMF